MGGFGEVFRGSFGGLSIAVKVAAGRDNIW